MPFTVVVAGHSYVYHLKQALLDPLQPSVMPGFNVSGCLTDFVYKRGGTTTDLMLKLDNIYDMQPDVVVLQIGGNDFTGNPNQDHVNTPDNIIGLAKQINKTQCVKAVFIGKLFDRFQNRHYLPTKEHVAQYNAKVSYINHALDIQAHSLRQQNIIVWNHRGRVTLRKQIISNDGTHLNAHGMYKWWRSIRGALLYAQDNILNG